VRLPCTLPACALIWASPACVPGVRVTSASPSSVRAVGADNSPRSVTNWSGIPSLTGSPNASTTCAVMRTGAPLTDVAAGSAVRVMANGSPGPMTGSGSVVVKPAACASISATPEVMPAVNTVAACPAEVMTETGSSVPSVAVKLTGRLLITGLPPSSRTVAVMVAVPLVMTGVGAASRVRVTGTPDVMVSGTVALNTPDVAVICAEPGSEPAVNCAIAVPWPSSVTVAGVSVPSVLLSATRAPSPAARPSGSVICTRTFVRPLMPAPVSALTARVRPGMDAEMARAAFSRPQPVSVSKPAVPTSSAVCRSRSYTAAWDRSGRSARTSAATPAAWGAANEVPLLEAGSPP